MEAQLENALNQFKLAINNDPTSVVNNNDIKILKFNHNTTKFNDFENFKIQKLFIYNNKYLYYDSSIATNDDDVDVKKLENHDLITKAIIINTTDNLESKKTNLTLESSEENNPSTTLEIMTDFIKQNDPNKFLLLKVEKPKDLLKEELRKRHDQIKGNLSGNSPRSFGSSVSRNAGVGIPIVAAGIGQALGGITGAGLGVLVASGTSLAIGATVFTGSTCYYFTKWSIAPTIYLLKDTKKIISEKIYKSLGLNIKARDIGLASKLYETYLQVSINSSFTDDLDIDTFFKDNQLYKRLAKKFVLTQTSYTKYNENNIFDKNITIVSRIFAKFDEVLIFKKNLEKKSINDSNLPTLRVRNYMAFYQIKKEIETFINDDEFNIFKDQLSKSLTTKRDQIDEILQKYTFSKEKLKPKLNEIADILYNIKEPSNEDVNKYKEYMQELKDEFGIDLLTQIEEAEEEILKLMGKSEDIAKSDKPNTEDIKAFEDNKKNIEEQIEKLVKFKKINIEKIIKNYKMFIDMRYEALSNDIAQKIMDVFTTNKGITGYEPFKNEIIQAVKEDLKTKIVRRPTEEPEDGINGKFNKTNGGSDLEPPVNDIYRKSFNLTTPLIDSFTNPTGDELVSNSITKDDDIAKNTLKLLIKHDHPNNSPYRTNGRFKSGKTIRQAFSNTQENIENLLHVIIKEITDGKLKQLEIKKLAEYKFIQDNQKIDEFMQKMNYLKDGSTILDLCQFSTGKRTNPKNYELLQLYTKYFNTQLETIHRVIKETLIKSRMKDGMSADEAKRFVTSNTSNDLSDYPNIVTNPDERETYNYIKIDADESYFNLDEGQTIKQDDETRYKFSKETLELFEKYRRFIRNLRKLSYLINDSNVYNKDDAYNPIYNRKSINNNRVNEVIRDYIKSWRTNYKEIYDKKSNFFKTTQEQDNIMKKLGVQIIKCKDETKAIEELIESTLNLSDYYQDMKTFMKLNEKIKPKLQELNFNLEQIQNYDKEIDTTPINNLSLPIMTGGGLTSYNNESDNEEYDNESTNEEYDYITQIGGETSFNKEKRSSSNRKFTTTNIDNFMKYFKIITYDLKSKIEFNLPDEDSKSILESFINKYLNILVGEKVNDGGLTEDDGIIEKYKNGMINPNFLTEKIGSIGSYITLSEIIVNKILVGALEKVLIIDDDNDDNSGEQLKVIRFELIKNDLINILIDSFTNISTIKLDVMKPGFVNNLKEKFTSKFRSKLGLQQQEKELSKETQELLNTIFAPQFSDSKTMQNYKKQLRKIDNIIDDLYKNNNLTFTGVFNKIQNDKIVNNLELIANDSDDTGYIKIELDEKISVDKNITKNNDIEQIKQVLTRLSDPSLRSTIEQAIDGKSSTEQLEEETISRVIED